KAYAPQTYVSANSTTPAFFFYTQYYNHSKELVKNTGMINVAIYTKVLRCSGAGKIRARTEGRRP
ncbi:hypothetical protein JXB22_03835, partial [candidate division WOR-3 bacterium]|nr:hypothetical protein [candidate division WOR-3 bacterium]